MLLEPAGIGSWADLSSRATAGYMRLDFRMGSACLALLDDRSDHCLEALAVTLQVGQCLHLRIGVYLSRHHDGCLKMFSPCEQGMELIRHLYVVDTAALYYVLTSVMHPYGNMLSRMWTCTSVRQATQAAPLAMCGLHWSSPS